MMRISTAQAFNTATRNLQERQVRLAESNDAMTSFLRVRTASDDPVAAARAERARALLQRTEATGVAISASRNAMTLTEAALGNAGDLLQQARELMVSAGNASYTDAERADIANQLAGIRTQLLSVANRSDGNGNYVFGGQGAMQPPFVDQTGGVAFVGLGGQVQVGSDERLPLSLDGEGIWMAAPTGNGVFTTANSNSAGAWIDPGHVSNPAALTGHSYSIEFSVNAGVTTYAVLDNGSPTAVTAAPFVSGQAIEIDGQTVAITGTPAQGDQFTLAPATASQSVFTALDGMIAELNTPLRSGTQVTQSVQSGIAALDSARNHVQSARSMTGEVLGRIDAIAGRNADTALFAQTTRSDAEDLDMVQAASDFQLQTTAYQVAMQTYASMQRMTLFDYIK